MIGIRMERGISRHAESQHRNISGRHRCIVGGFRSHQSLHRPLSKGHLGIFRHPLGVIVGKKRRDISARAGQCSDKDSHQGSLNGQRKIVDHIAHMGADFVHLLFDAGGKLHVPNLDQGFGKSEQTDHCHDIADAGSG